MPGYIRPRGKNSWQICVNAGRDPVTGRRRQRFATVRGKRKDAEAVCTRLLYELDTGLDLEPGRVTTDGFVERWLRDYAQVRTAPKTSKRYGELLRLHVLPVIGGIPLAKLRPSHIQTVLARMLASGLSARTVLHAYRVIKVALGHAVKWQLLARNPADAIEPPKPEASSINPPGPAAIVRILEAATRYPYQALIHAAVMTGLRQGEVLGLRWKDLDLDAGLLYVAQTVQWLPEKGFVFRSPKTSKSRRVVHLSPLTVTRLREHRQRQLEERVLLGPAYRDNDLVFASATGAPIDPANLRRSWKGIINRAEVGHVRFHDLRHAHATLLIQQGEHVKLISERLGHASIGITMDTYGHLLPGMQAQAAARLDALFDKAATASGGQ
jgi:integrase